ncbi:structural maintenance of chromosomes protein 5 [Oryza sativa Japonica Group]|uniref:Structural maintenance of chromosomes protein 5 n=1 Tax=Oryza sativa subsp. japonica TaxID=39947 RepID=A0A0P0Y3Q2_ORYSJ|nr:structural maintenance of chromosomes protein 5 [Oryza sativa Japonica Group]KAB8115634.1 hypothetical protein EE612_056257 [Oryza sativa]BAT14542.1 Os11g0572900 [Oryza sativa Japonica Group]
MATSAARAAKRARIAAPPPPTPTPTHLRRGDGGYVPGNIVEIELSNFMTYHRLACRPGPRLNLVLGPNGSGKSSLVCAIALALAADPGVLGRVASVGAFVKRGEESGHVKISLAGTHPNTLSASRGRSIPRTSPSGSSMAPLCQERKLLISSRNSIFKLIT